MATRHPLDGYDYTADVPVGTPLLVRSVDGTYWRLAKRGARYHEDVRTRIHGAKRAKPPPEVAASDRIRAVLESCLSAGGDLPADAGQPTANWSDAPSTPGSLAPTASLSVYAGGLVRAVQPVYDDAPRTGVRRLSAKELARLSADVATAPRGVRLQTVPVRERTVRVEPSHQRAAVAPTVPGARAERTKTYYRTDAQYEDALRAPGARLAFEGGPVDVPEPGTAWRVPVTAWRAAVAALEAPLAPDASL